MGDCQIYRQAERQINYAFLFCIDDLLSFKLKSTVSLGVEQGGREWGWIILHTGQHMYLSLSICLACLQNLNKKINIEKIPYL